MIFGETASVCALPAPVKPKRCFRSLPLSCALPLPWSALGLTFPIAFSIWAMKQQENTLWAVAGSGKMCRFPQPAIRRGEVDKGMGEGLSKKLKHYLHFSYDTTTIYYTPQHPLPLLILARRLSTLQPEDVDSCCCCCCRGWGCDVTGGC